MDIRVIKFFIPGLLGVMIGAIALAVIVNNYKQSINVTKTGEDTCIISYKEGGKEAIEVKDRDICEFYSK